ncbi:putative protein phosphatase 2C 2 [Porphyridium purpureum]|uniref:PPM-type phosphatase domain-containing protein n=1 Tax=Porphyridium purpureum TaxID=35688 RepID=A0A5J4YLX0_PORPP|nr:putative protein phosphatase 2C 2 [Porphyridium purpureum]|eukprot:POR7683..scf246_12
MDAAAATRERRSAPRVENGGAARKVNERSGAAAPASAAMGTRKRPPRLALTVVSEADSRTGSEGSMVIRSYTADSNLSGDGKHVNDEEQSDYIMTSQGEEPSAADTSSAHRCRYWLLSRRGKKRSACEDACCVMPGDDFIFFGVFDGHGGAHASQYAAQNLPINVTSHAKFRNGDVLDAMKAGFLDTDEFFLRAQMARRAAAQVAFVRNQESMMQTESRNQFRSVVLPQLEKRISSHEDKDPNGGSGQQGEDGSSKVKAFGGNSTVGAPFGRQHIKSPEGTKNSPAAAGSSVSDELAADMGRSLNILEAIGGTIDESNPNDESPSTVSSLKSPRRRMSDLSFGKISISGITDKGTDKADKSGPSKHLLKSSKFQELLMTGSNRCTSSNVPVSPRGSHSKRRETSSLEASTVFNASAGDAQEQPSQQQDKQAQERTLAAPKSAVSKGKTLNNVKKQFTSSFTNHSSSKDGKNKSQTGSFAGYSPSLIQGNPPANVSEPEPSPKARAALQSPMSVSAPNVLEMDDVSASPALLMSPRASRAKPAPGLLTAHQVESATLVSPRGKPSNIGRLVASETVSGAMPFSPRGKAAAEYKNPFDDAQDEEPDFGMGLGDRAGSAKSASGGIKSPRRRPVPLANSLVMPSVDAHPAGTSDQGHSSTIGSAPPAAENLKSPRGRRPAPLSPGAPEAGGTTKLKPPADPSEASRKRIAELSSTVASAGAGRGGKPSEAKDPFGSGSTAVTAIIKNGKLYVAHVGDSRAVVSNGGVADQLTEDHRASRDDEASRIEEAGGFVLMGRVAGVLAVSRGLGDEKYKKYITAEPEVSVRTLTADDRFLILATDGLWDWVPNQDAVDLIEQMAKDDAALFDLEAATMRIVDEALARGSVDDCTVLVIDLRCFTTT